MYICLYTILKTGLISFLHTIIQKPQSICIASRLLCKMTHFIQNYTHKNAILFSLSSNHPAVSYKLNCDQYKTFV